MAVSYFLAFVLFVCVAYKALNLQLLNRDRAFKIAQRQHTNSLSLLPKRGKILDRNNVDLATSIVAHSIYVKPNEIDSLKEFASKLSKVTNITYRQALSFAVSNKSFLWLTRTADEKVVKKLKELKLQGIGFIEEPKRFYPNNHLLGQALGFTNIDSKGIEGIEYLFDGILRGTPYKLRFRKDARGKLILENPISVENLTRGLDIVLTIDSRIQHIVEKELEQGIKKTKAKSGMAVMIDPETGEIVAMASYPFFNPNDFSKYPSLVRRNKPVWYTFEPGSTMKIFLVASALEEGKVRPTTIYDCENGRRKVGPKIIKDIHPYRMLSVAETIQESSNICASKIGETLGKETYFSYLKQFGFGSKTEIDLPGEQKGIVPKKNKWGPVELATISFGQGISVTSLQLAVALSTIANGGYLLKPYIVKRIVSSSGKIIREKRPEIKRRVISYDTAIQVSSMLEQVVKHGTGKKAQISGYRVAGKTGTAQIPDNKNGGYYPDKYMASFIGFAPVEDPKLVLVVVVEDPKTSIYGGEVAAPIFKSIMEKALLIKGIPPEEELLETIVMPNFQGKSARDILRWAQQEKIEVEIKGSGYSFSQHPPPGKKVKKDTKCFFKLKQDI